jgi:uncharacterized protein (DUF362 family)
MERLEAVNDERMSRRELLARAAGAVLVGGAACAAGYLLYDPKGDAGLPRPSDNRRRLRNYFESVDLPASSPRLSIATGGVQTLQSGNEAAVEKLVRAAVGALDPQLGMKRFVSAGDVVLIKPNVGFDRAPHLGATTHPEVVRALIKLCREAGATKIIVTDNLIEAPEACFAKSGIQRAAEQAGAEIVIPARNLFETLTIRDRDPLSAQGEALGQWPILYGPLAAATKVIGVAPIKDHNLCSASMNLKNWYGLLGGRRNQFHQAIHDIVSDLALMMSPTLVVADGTRVMMRNGPTGGRVSDVKEGGELGRPTIVASVDPVACDAWCYQNFLGRDPAKLAYLDLAERKIAEQIAGGAKRLGRRDWRTYDRAGLVATTNM